MTAFLANVFFNGLLELLQAAVLADGANGSLAAVPVLRSAIDARRHRGTLAVYCDAAEDGGRAVSLYFATVDVL